jgi:hypothetical protein
MGTATTAVIRAKCRRAMEPLGKRAQLKWERHLRQQTRIEGVWFLRDPSPKVNNKWLLFNIEIAMEAF